MNLQNIELVAKEACYSLDNNIKMQAENMFKEFVFGLNVENYAHILEGYSQTVLFVFLSYVDKKIPQSDDVMNIFYVLAQSGRQWIQLNGEFKRNIDQQPLIYYVTNTLGMVLGRCMKHLYINQSTRKQLTQYLTSLSNSLFKVFLYKNMIEIVSVIDPQMQYIQYRTLIYSFQEKIIPLILNEMNPYFILIADTMKVNQLSSMIPKLGMQEGMGYHQQSSLLFQQQSINVNSELPFELFPQNQRTISQLVFKLLEQIVNFKYNITFSEYDLETQFENIMVSFPESVLTHLTSKDFLQGFYFMLQKMCYCNYSGTYTDCGFQCLKKILLSKITYLGKQERLNLATMHYYGLTRILMTVNLSYQKLTNQVFQCLYKFLHSFQFSDLQKAHINHLQLLSLIKQKSILIISTTPLTNDNPLYQSVTSVMLKIAGQAIAMSQQKYQQFYCEMCRQFYTVFLQNFLLKGENICGNVQMSKISAFKSTLNEYFFNINRTASMDMRYLFQLLLSKSTSVFNSHNQQVISNFLHLITDICQENFYDRSLTYEATKQQDLLLLGEIMHKCFQYINYYKKKSSELKQSSIAVQLAIVLFFEKLLNECLDNLSTDQQDTIILLSKTYKVINSYQNINLSHQDFILYCFKQLLQNLKTQSCQKVDYILEVMYNLLLKLKFSLKREIFIQSKISRQILEYIVNLSESSLSSSFQIQRLRRKLFKNITILSFDDVLDTYRENINYVVQTIQNDFNSKMYTKIIFDMSGICENIDAPVIYRYFLNRIDEKIGLNNLIMTLYENFNNDFSLLQEIVYFNKSLLIDKGLRMSNKQLSILLYSIIDYSFHYISVILSTYKDQSVSQVMQQTYQLANIILDSSYINLFLIKRKCEENFIMFLKSLINNMLNIHLWAVHYPQLAKHFYEAMRIFLINCSQIILVIENPQYLLSEFADLTHCVMYYVERKLMEVQQGSKENHLCQKLLQSIGKFYSFLRYKKNFAHREVLISNIKNLIVINQNKTVQFMHSLYKLAMSNVKNFSTLLNCICITIMELSYFYPLSYHQIFKTLGISQDKIQKFQKIFVKVSTNQQDSLFVINLREWLAISDTKDLQDIDY